MNETCREMAGTVRQPPTSYLAMTSYLATKSYLATNVVDRKNWGSRSASR